MPDLFGDIANTWPYLAGPLLGYLLGSIPFGLVLTRMAGLGDIRDIGSGSIGATNVLRTGSKPLALATVVLDSAKGAIAVGFGYLASQEIALLAGGAAFLGHCFPIWLKFKGGKGFATFLGILLAIDWQLCLAGCLTWLVMAAVFRYSSLSSLTAAITAPVFAYWLTDPKVMYLVIFLAGLIFIRHHENISRLIKGEESKIGGKKGDGPENE